MRIKAGEVVEVGGRKDIWAKFKGWKAGRIRFGRVSGSDGG